MGESIYEGKAIMAEKEVVSGVTDFRVEIAGKVFVLEFSGHDVDGNWANAKRIVGDPNALVQAIMKIVQEMT